MSTFGFLRAAMETMSTRNFVFNSACPVSFPARHASTPRWHTNFPNFSGYLVLLPRHPVVWNARSVRRHKSSSCAALPDHTPPPGLSAFAMLNTHTHRGLHPMRAARPCAAHLHLVRSPRVGKTWRGVARAIEQRGLRRARQHAVALEEGIGACRVSVDLVLSRLSFSAPTAGSPTTPMDRMAAFLAWTRELCSRRLRSSRALATCRLHDQRSTFP